MEGFKKIYLVFYIIFNNATGFQMWESKDGAAKQICHQTQLLEVLVVPKVYIFYLFFFSRFNLFLPSLKWKYTTNVQL